MTASTLREQDVARLRAALPAIMAEAASTGNRLPPERELAQRLGTSRRLLRVALEEQEAAGAIFRRRGQGTFVAPPPHPVRTRTRLLAGRLTLAQLMDVRRQIEPRIAELAAEAATDEDLERLEDLLHRSCSATDARAYDIVDELFHYRIAEMSGNALYLEFFGLIRQLRKEAGWRDQRARTNSERIMAQLCHQHRVIFSAIAAGDTDAARRAQLTHMEFVASALRSDSGAAP